MEKREEPVLRHARREACVIIAAWAAATGYCCAFYYLFGTIRPGRQLGPSDLHPTLGMPAWFFWGVILPWVACVAFTTWFAGRVMTDDALGTDRADGLDDEIRGGAADG